MESAGNTEIIEPRASVMTKDKSLATRGNKQGGVVVKKGKEKVKEITFT